MTLAEMSPGDQVKISMYQGKDENGGEIWKDTAFIVVQQGKPAAAYDDSFLGGTVLMQGGKSGFYRQKLLEHSNTGKQGQKCDYSQTCAHQTYLAAGGAYEQLLDPAVAAQVRTVCIPYRSGTSGTTVKYTLEAKYWLPSAVEVARVGGEDRDAAEEDEIYVQEGARFALFAGKTLSFYDQWQVDNPNDGLDFWFTRTPAESEGSTGFYAVDELGRAYPAESGEYAVRVCMVLPGNARVGSSGHLHFGASVPVRQEGVWKSGVNFCRIDGVWREVSGVSCKIDGVWKA